MFLHFFGNELISDIIISNGFLPSQWVLSAFSLCVQHVHFYFRAPGQLEKNSETESICMSAVIDC